MSRKTNADSSPFTSNKSNLLINDHYLPLQQSRKVNLGTERRKTIVFSFLKVFCPP